LNDEAGGGAHAGTGHFVAIFRFLIRWCGHCAPLQVRLRLYRPIYFQLQFNQGAASRAPLGKLLSCRVQAFSPERITQAKNTRLRRTSQPACFAARNAGGAFAGFSIGWNRGCDFCYLPVSETYTVRYALNQLQLTRRSRRGAPWRGGQRRTGSVAERTG